MSRLSNGMYLGIGLVVFLVVPTTVYVIVGSLDPTVLVWLHYAIATAYAVTSVLLVREAWSAWPRKIAPVAVEQAVRDLPLISIIVSAYLPNEQDVVAETILHLSTALRAPTYLVQIILAYNTPDDLEVEQSLAALGALNVAFTPLRVEGSHSKAENIVAAMALVRGEMTVLLDADHHPLPDALERAWRWLESGYDVVQGRCVVRDRAQTWLTRYVSIEFEQIYAVSHAARSLDVDTAIFGGSNGYWRTSTLRRIGMDTAMLTEDVDASVRAMLAGYRVVHDRSIISSELATPTLGRWWRQRLRWAQGWFQVTLRHQSAIWRSPYLRRSQKVYWTLLLAWREAFPFIALQIAGLLAAATILHVHVDWFSNPYLVATTALTLLSGPAVALVAYRVALWQTKKTMARWFVFYAASSLVYVTLKNAVAMTAVVREFFGERTWVVTPRHHTRPARART